MDQLYGDGPACTAHPGGGPVKIPDSPDLTVEVVSTEADLLAARRFQAERYLRAGYIDSLGADGVIDDPWIEHSRYVVAFRAPTRNIVGVCRFIFHSPAGFPILSEFELDPVWVARLDREVLERCLEISSFAVAGEGLAHTMVSALLYRELARFTADNPDIIHVLAAVDQRFLRILRRWMNFPFEAMGQPRDYMGSSTLPVYGYMPQLVQAVADGDGDQSDFLLDGRSYDEIADFVVDLRESAPSLSETTAPL